MDLHNMHGLLIDDVAEMRTSVRIQLSDCGLQHCICVRNVKEAIDKLAVGTFDLVICDYDLGQGADGQQLLELVRRKHLLPLSTAFLMITGETAYQQVSTAAEFSPDDYLLKPFTAEILKTRLLKVLEKKTALKPIYQHMGVRPDLASALAACDRLLAEKTRYSADVLRLKGELLMREGRHQEALALYESILGLRATPWATVGKASALRACGRTEDARTELENALQAYPNYLAAYDTLSEMLQEEDKFAAQEVVERALKVSASTRRQREMGELALDNGDFERAETAYRVAVERDRTGFFKSHDDYAGLSRSCLEQGKQKEALIAIKDMAQHFKSSDDLKARQAALECQVHTRAGDDNAARLALARAMELHATGELDAAATLEIAQACFAAGNPEEAKEIIRAVAEDHHENPEVIARARGVFAVAGLKEEGVEFLEATSRHMIRLNNEAVALAKSGQLDQAIDMLTKAADRLRNNAQVLINAAQAILMRLSQQGMNADALAQALGYIEQAIRVNPEHPKLAGALSFYKKVAPADAPQPQLPLQV
jgi:tetratricopeptide (TPR) repeat protein